MDINGNILTEPVKYYKNLETEHIENNNYITGAHDLDNINFTGLEYHNTTETNEHDSSKGENSAEN